MGWRAAGSLLLLLVFLLGGIECWDAAPHQRGNAAPPVKDGLCDALLLPAGYPCEEHIVQTKDGYILSLQHITHGRNSLKTRAGPPVFLQHGLFMAGDAWFINTEEQSLGFILADEGFDVWVGNVRGTHWSQGHLTLSVHDKEFWDWSWEELALYDLGSMLTYVYSFTQSRVLFVGHSQGTIMALAAFTVPEIVKMVDAAALLCPISYLNHISSKFTLTAVNIHLDQMLLALGIHELNFRSDVGLHILDLICDDGHMDCNRVLSFITGENCCINMTRKDYFFRYEPHPSSMKNLIHLFQMIRKGTFARYDYGWLSNMWKYGRLRPPDFNLGDVLESLPLWMGYGGKDALADPTDIKRTILELKRRPDLLYNGSYGHLDFLLSVTASSDVYDELISFFRSTGGWPSSS